MSKIIPRIFILFACLIMVLPRYRSILLGLFCLMKIILSVLTSENLKPERCAHSYSLFRINCRVFWIVCMFSPTCNVGKVVGKEKGLNWKYYLDHGFVYGD